MPLSNTTVTGTDTSAWEPGARGLVSAASFWSPIRSGVGSGWIEHAPFAFWLIEALLPCCFVELGTYTGYSYSAICQAVQRLGTQTACHAIDTWQGDEHTGFHGGAVFEDLQAFNAQHFSSFSRLIRATFSEAARHFADGSVDLLHINGRHSYEEMKADYEEWERKLTPDAVVLFHDINAHEHGLGAARFWSEISRDRPHFAFLHGHGLGVLGSAEVRSPRLEALFQASGNEAATTELRACYARLGGALADRYCIQTLHAKADLAKETVLDLQRQLAVLQQERDAFEAWCQERDGMAADLRRQVAYLTREKAADLRGQITDLTREKVAFEDGCKERDEVLLELRDQIADLKRERAAFEDGCKEREEIMAELRRQATDLMRERAAFEGGCQDRDLIIIQLRLQIAELTQPRSNSDDAWQLPLVAALRDQIATHDQEIVRLIGTMRHARCSA